VLDLGEPVTSLAAGGDVLWVGLRRGGVARIDPAGPSLTWVRTVPLT